MRFMMIVKANKDSEAGVLPDEKMLATMGKYNEELVKAGVLLDATGLAPSSQGARVRFSAGGKRSVIDGPFTEAKELIAGYWLIQVKSKDEAIEWAKRIPFEPDPKTGEDPEVELRRLHELEDFAPGPAVERARALGEQLARNK
ncbi:MAG: YciI family protein [Deltaproteobacteria bacterium]|nr:MAG: YciI family protein [Deltaproteobacteria bacterium]